MKERDEHLESVLTSCYLGRACWFRAHKPQMRPRDRGCAADRIWPVVLLSFLPRNSNRVAGFLALWAVYSLRLTLVNYWGVTNVKRPSFVVAAARP